MEGDRMKKYVDKNALQIYTTKLIEKSKTLFAAKSVIITLNLVAYFVTVRYTILAL